MEYPEEEWFQISALNKFAFCQRQFALIYVEDQWSDNLYTTSGHIEHERVHDPSLQDSRKDKIIMRAMRVFSAELGVSGECDVVEFVKSFNGVPVKGHDGLWQPIPVEYKHGKPDDDTQESPDAVQLCCQAMCLEHMLCCQIDYGFLFYIATKRRVRVEFIEPLRQTVMMSLQKMHELSERHHVPTVKKKKVCKYCSLYELCLPQIFSKGSVKKYVDGSIELR